MAKVAPKIIKMKTRDGLDIDADKISAIRVSPDGAMGAIFI